MPGKVRVVSDYPVSADTLWAITKDLDALVEMNSGMVKMEGVPSGDMYAGQQIDARVSLFGFLPKQSYGITVLEVDNAYRLFRSTEQGSGVKSWNHTGRVEETPDGSRLIDEIEIDAGWKTPLVVAWANRLYRARHKPRLRLLEKRGLLG
ncbi:SRPBCC family protein [Pseudooceanicola sp.]|uniref:SRPBCC family protein n=1 Tax=Pseudooceanicola sp. TaxID=1914328 RepID=UPI0035C688B3